MTTPFTQITTPLGPVEFTIALDGIKVVSAPTAVAIAEGATERIAAWTGVGGVRALLRIVELEDSRAVSIADGGDVKADHVWGAVLTVHAVEECRRIEFRASLAAGLSGDWYTGEELAARQFTKGPIELLLGGGDGDFFARRIRAGLLPSHWGPLMRPDRAGTVFGESGRDVRFPPDVVPVLGIGEDGLGWMLPSLLAGQTVHVHVAVAWAEGAFAAEAAWFAVDTTPEAILRACTLAPPQ